MGGSIMNLKQVMNKFEEFCNGNNGWNGWAILFAIAFGTPMIVVFIKG
jgi:hypothetical protein